LRRGKNGDPENLTTRAFGNLGGGFHVTTKGGMMHEGGNIKTSKKTVKSKLRGRTCHRETNGNEQGRG